MNAMTLTEFFRDFYKPLRLRGRSANTVRLYGNTVKQFDKFLGRPSTLDDLCDLTMSRYLDHRCAMRSVFTAEKERSQLFAMWRCAADRRMIEFRPTLQVTQMPTRIPTAWSLDQLRQLVATAKVAKGNIGDVPARVFWPALILVLWQCAERIGAVMSCTKADYVRPRLLVRAEYRKGGKRDKLYTFTDSVCDLLDVLAATGPSEHLFYWPKNREYMWSLFGKLIQQSGIPSQKKARFHQLRRSAATFFTASGGDAVALLDHSNPKTTKAYLDPRFIDSGPKPCDVLPDIG
jgi:site-specific recombinase XerD